MRATIIIAFVMIIFGTSWADSTYYNITCKTLGVEIKSFKQNVICPANCVRRFNRVFGTNHYTGYSEVCAAAIHDGRITNAGGKVTVYTRVGQHRFKGSIRHGVHSVRDDGYYWVFFQFQEVSACKLLDMQESAKVYTVDCPKHCTDKVMIFGSGIYHTRSGICNAAFFDGVIKKGRGGRVTVYKVRTVDIHKWKQRWETKNGVKSYTRVYNEHGFLFNAPAIPCSINGTSIEEKDWFVGFCPPRFNEVNYQVKGNNIYSEDSNICAAAVHDGQINADTGGLISGYRTSGLTSYVGNYKHGITSTTHGVSRASFTFQVSCSTTAEKFTADLVMVICPSYTECRDIPEDTRRIYGTYVYADVSSICMAATMDQTIRFGQSKAVHIKKSKGMLSYCGTYSKATDIQSHSYNSTQNSFIFKIPVGTPHGIRRKAKHKSCLLQGSDFTEERFDVECSGYCYLSTDSVWGSGVYTDNSYICKAALIDGKLLKNQFQTVHVEILEGQSSYNVSQNGDPHTWSRSHGPWHRSFRFTDE
ncbi:uncharacterized protein LOC100185406 isoform X2 [Ciona intestinalis]